MIPIVVLDTPTLVLPFSVHPAPTLPCHFLFSFVMDSPHPWQDHDGTGTFSTESSLHPSVPSSAPTPDSSPEYAVFSMLAQLRDEAREARDMYHRQFERMNDNMRLLTELVASLRAPAPAAPAPAPAPAPAAPAPVSSALVVSAPPAPDRGLRAREPRDFSGAADQLVSFLSELKAYIRLSRIHSNDDKNDVLFLHLKDGAPRMWYNALVHAKSPLLHNFDALLQDFEQKFGDPNLGGTKFRTLQALKQTGSCFKYATSFRELLAYVDLSEPTKIHMFKEGLKEIVRTHMVGAMPFPSDFNTYVNLAIEYDNALHEDRTFYGRSSGPRSAPAPHPRAPAPSPAPAAPPAGSTDVVPMEVDAVKVRGPLSQEEKDRRRRLGLCMYCGKAGHMANACPAAKKRVSPSQAPAPAGNA